MNDERLPDDLEELLAELRAPAQPGELDGETSIVAAMTSAHHASGVTTMTPGRSRRARVAAMIAAGVIGFGGVAAAGPGGFDVLGSGSPDDTTAPETSTTTTTSAPTTTSTTTSTTSTSTSTTTTTTSSTAVTSTTSAETTTPTSVVSALSVDDPTTEFDETQCAEGNHGQTVSSVAQSVPPGPGHGEQVSIAAHSSCGKDADDRDADDDESSDDDGRPDHAGKPEHPGNGKP